MDLLTTLAPGKEGSTGLYSYDRYFYIPPRATSKQNGGDDETVHSGIMGKRNVMMRPGGARAEVESERKTRYL